MANRVRIAAWRRRRRSSRLSAMSRLVVLIADAVEADMVAGRPSPAGGVPGVGGARMVAEIEDDLGPDLPDWPEPVGPSPRNRVPDDPHPSDLAELGPQPGHDA